ncbi:hypothetical protein CCP4SC76_2490007 [Gammaproteobacteria bacterium]
MRLKPDYARAQDNRLFALNYAANLAPEAVLAEARRWDVIALSDTVRDDARQQRFSRLPRHGRHLRIGYVSGDYRHHAVSFFIEQLFAHHDRTRIEVFAYSTHPKRDTVTEHLEQRHADHWRSLYGVAAPLRWLGMSDPTDSQEFLRSDDPEVSRLEALLTAWHAVFGGTAVTIAEVIQRATTGFDATGTGETLRQAAVDVAGDNRSLINPRMLAWYCKHHTGRIVGGLRLLCDRNYKTPKWRATKA